MEVMVPFLVYTLVVFTVGYWWGSASVSCVKCDLDAQAQADKAARLKRARENGEVLEMAETDEVPYDPEDETQRADWWKHGRRPDWEERD